MELSLVTILYPSPENSLLGVLSRKAGLPSLESMRVRIVDAAKLEPLLNRNQLVRSMLSG